MGWRWIAVWLMALPVMALALLWPRLTSDTPAAGPVSDPVSITHYQADYEVDAQGTLTATETITAEFPRHRHGIFRYWDITNPNVAGVRQIPTVTSVRMDGQPVRYDLLERNSGRFRIAKIGDPYSTLTPGEHVFEVRYTVAGVLDPGSTGSDLTFASGNASADEAPSVFLWNVVAPGWENKIDRADITVRLPGSIDGVQCSVGWGRGRSCTDITVAGNTLKVAATKMSPRTPVTVRVGVAAPTPPRAELSWSMDWERVLGTSPGGPSRVGAFTLLAALLGVVLYLASREKAPPFPLQYGPPAGIGPAQFEMIRTKSPGSKALVATVFHLADRGLVDVRQLKQGKWSVVRTSAPLEVGMIDPVSMAVLGRLGLTDRGDSFTADGSVAAGKRLSAAGSDLKAAVHGWAYDGGLLVARSSVQLVRIIAGLSVFFAVPATFRAFGATMWVLPFAMLFVLCVPTWAPRYRDQRSPAGRELWARAGGFHRMLSTDAAEARFDFAARSDLYTTNLPYAIAAGIANEWAEKYHAETGAQPPTPDWLQLAAPTGGSSRTVRHSSRPTGAGLLAATHAVDTFERSLSSSIGAYTASLNVSAGNSSAGGSWGSGSRRSSFGGGGSSSGSRGGGGRGGGGGGGGSW